MAAITDILEKSELFLGLTAEDYEALAKVFVPSHFKPGDRILTKGDSGDSLYIIAQGTTLVHDGSVELAKLGPGSFFGEMAFFEQTTRSVSITADSDVIAYYMIRDDFNILFKSRPHILQNMVAAITKRIGLQNQRIVAKLKLEKEELDRLVDEKTAELRSTQDQLVQQGKLAQLGQMTAAIAHEIKNPLNFVTNFAKLSLELLDEVLAPENESNRKESADYLRKNIQKVFEHGTRAESIIKGMLEHSRSSFGGTRNPEDVNMICDQFLKIALEAFKMNNKGFDVELEIHMNRAIPRLEVAPLDISKVFMNIFMNAFYSMNERKKTESGYTPILEIESKIFEKNAMFSIKDNGMGMPEEDQKQVFNPFFTTKPTGKGTGLGLSISNDIIKAHGGVINCRNRETGGAEFTISLPIKS